MAGKSKKPVTAHASEQIASAFSRMPVDPDVQRVLHERALVFAHDTANKDVAIRETFLRVRLGPTEYYGISYACLEHIMKLTDMARIPCTPSVIAGVANYRGELLTLFDLKQLFHTEVAEQEAEIMVVVVRVGKMRVGLLVDEVEWNDEFVVADLEPPMHTGGLYNLDYVQGIHQGHVTILNIEALLADPQLQVDEFVK